MKDELRGPVEELTWAKRLMAHVVTPGARPRIHGYEVRDDLLTNCGFGGLILLALTGELPDQRTALVFEKAMIFLSPVSVAEAPVHASVLAGLCGTDSSGVIGVAGLTLAQQARQMVTEHAGLIEALETRRPLPVSAFSPDTEGGADEIHALLEAVSQAGFILPPRCSELSPLAGALVVLHQCCGLKKPEDLEAAIVIARMPCALAEARAVQAGDFRSYPIDLPAFRYTDEG